MGKKLWILAAGMFSSCRRDHQSPHRIRHWMAPAKSVSPAGRSVFESQGSPRGAWSPEVGVQTGGRDNRVLREMLTMKDPGSEATHHKMREPRKVLNAVQDSSGGDRCFGIF